MLKLLFFLTLNLSFADSTLQEGLDAFQKGDFDSAHKSFEQLYSEPQMKFTALFNLGNVAVKQKQGGLALAYYRRAQLINPRDKDLSYNMSFVNQQFKLSPPAGNISSYEILRQNIFTIFTFNEVAGVCLIAMILFLMSLYKFLKARKLSEDKPLPSPALFIWGLMFIALLSLSITKLIDCYTARATVISSKTELRSGPTETNAALMELSEGTEVFINDSASNTYGMWKQVTVPGNLTGWVLDKNLMQTTGEGPW